MGSSDRATVASVKQTNPRLERILNIVRSPPQLETARLDAFIVPRVFRFIKAPSGLVPVGWPRAWETTDLDRTKMRGPLCKADGHRRLRKSAIRVVPVALGLGTRGLVPVSEFVPLNGQGDGGGSGRRPAISSFA